MGRARTLRGWDMTLRVVSVVLLVLFVLQVALGFSGAWGLRASSGRHSREPHAADNLGMELRGRRIKLRGSRGPGSAVSGGSGPGAMFTCADGTRIKKLWVNDDFCDCADGSDETRTSACSPRGQFLCPDPARGMVLALAVPSSRVHDGVCDCCDGSDERAANRCEDTCASLRRQHEQQEETARAGRRIRQAQYVGATRARDARGAATGGPDGAFFRLSHRCLRLTHGEYDYELCPYVRATQQKRGGRGKVSLARSFDRWSETVEGAALVGGGGDACPGGRSRSVVLHFTCAEGDALTSVSERETCIYHMDVSTPAACESTGA